MILACRKVFSLAALIVFASHLQAFAQAGYGELSGTITDPSHASIPHASVKLQSKANGQTRDTISSPAGDYRFTAVPIGSYTLEVSAPGFKTFQATDITLTVGTTSTQDVSLTLGAATDVVEVTGDTVEQVQTDTSALSQLIDSTVWKSSPLETRTQNAFINLVAGATPDDPNSTTFRGAAVDGARTGTGNYLLEGMDNNEQGQGGVALVGVGGASLTLSPDAIEEYRVITHDAPASYGRSGGFSTDTVLKSGSNNWHGSAFEYNRVQALAAQHWFSNNGNVKDSLVRNQFGGSIGGPIIKDRTFFFATVEIHHLRNSNPVTGTTTTQNFIDFVKSGAFQTFMEGTTQQDPSTPTLLSGEPAPPQIGACPAFTGEACPGGFATSATTGPIFDGLSASEPSAFPHPQVPQGATVDNNVAQGLVTAGALRYPVPVYAQATILNHQSLNQNRGSLKLDHRLTQNDQLSFAYAIDQIEDSNTTGGGDGVFGPADTQLGGAQFFVGAWTHTFSPTLLNVFRVGYLRHVSNFAIASSLIGIPSITAADPLLSSLGHSSGLPQDFTENQFTYQDSLAKTIGAHALKVGFQYMRTRNGSSFFNDVDGTIIFNGVEDVVTDGTFGEALDTAAFGGPTYGSMYEAAASIDPSTQTVPNVYRGYRANEVSAFVQDDWKVTSRLTLNAGLRWDYFGPPHNAAKGFDSNVYFGAFGAPTPNSNPFFPNTPLAGGLQGATFIQKDSNIWNKDTNNFGPRLGFSYDLTGQGKLVMRGGFGVGFDRLYNNAYENLRFNPPRFADNSIGAFINGIPAGPSYLPGIYQVPFAGNTILGDFGGKPVPRHIDQRLVTAYYEQANFGFEYELAKGYVVETNYVGTFGRKLVGLLNINTYPGRTGCPAGGGTNDDGTYTPDSPCGSAGFPDGFSSGRINRIFNNDNFRTNAFSSNYNAFQLSVRKAFSDGLRLSGNYTYSKSMDQISDVFRQRNGATGPTDSQHPSLDYGPSDFDLKHRAVITINYEEQWKKNNLILGGWGLAPILSFSSGYPVSLSDSAHDPNQNGTFSDRPQYLGTGGEANAVHSGFSKSENAFRQITSSSFGPVTCPPQANFGIWCNSPTSRNAVYGPHTTNIDLAVLKHFRITEHQAVTFEANIFNVFNHANFGDVDGNVADGSFGLARSSTDPRITQLALRYDF